MINNWISWFMGTWVAAVQDISEFNLFSKLFWKSAPSSFQAGTNHMTSPRSADNRREAHAAKNWNIQSLFAHATICQATLSFQGKSWAENDIIAWLGEVWTHNLCWMCSHTSVNADLSWCGRNWGPTRKRMVRGKKKRWQLQNSKKTDERNTIFKTDSSIETGIMCLLTNFINYQWLQAPITDNHSPKQHNFKVAHVVAFHYFFARKKC